MSIYHQRTDSKMNSEPPPEHSAGKSSSTTEDSSSAPGAGMNQGTKRAREDAELRTDQQKTDQQKTPRKLASPQAMSKSLRKDMTTSLLSLRPCLTMPTGNKSGENQNTRQNKKIKSQTGQGEKNFDLRNYTTTTIPVLYTLIFFKNFQSHHTTPRHTTPQPTSTPAQHLFLFSFYFYSTVPVLGKSNVFFFY